MGTLQSSSLLIGKLLEEIWLWQYKILTLISKKQNATLVLEFLPISCCNATYKVISKILAKRLKQVLPSVISNTQSTFIPGRLLIENVLMTTELIQGYNWKNISNRSMLKVDLKKALDSLDWSFIVLILRALRFPEFWSLSASLLLASQWQLTVSLEGILGVLVVFVKAIRDPLIWLF